MRNGQPELLWNFLFEKFRQWETLLAVVFLVSIFPIPPLPLELPLSTTGSQFKKQGSLWKMQTHIMKREGEVFQSVLENSAALLFCALFASFCGENHPQHQRSRSHRNGVEISILQVLGQCPRSHGYSSFSLRVLDADSSSCELSSYRLHLCSIFSASTTLPCPQSIFLQESTCPLRSGLNPPIKF